jgi:uncharacterized protein (TIGR00269 family)
MKCSVCGRKAVIELKHTRKAFCKEHFIDSFEKRVKSYVKKNHLVNKKDRIAVGVSGGKDSLTLLYLLSKWYPGQVLAITIDEGIKGYRGHTIKIVENYVKKWGVEYVNVSFLEETGFSLDEMSKKLGGIPCSYCGIFRRYYLNKTAREAGATKLAIGHNLDDEAQSIIMNLFQHDFQRFARMGPIPGVARNKKFVVRIKPLRMVMEKETRAYFFLKGFPHRIWECPYLESAFRNTIRNLLNSYEAQSPGTKARIVSAYDKHVKSLKEENLNVGFCERCGEPSSSNICRACMVLEELHEGNG